MVYTASLNVPVKKALQKIVNPSTVNKICDNLILDPDSTKMTCVILGPKDFTGPKGMNLEKALNNKHPDICVIYLYTSAADADLCPNAYCEQARKITDKVVSAAFEKYAGDHAEETGKRQMSTADFDEPDEENVPQTGSAPIIEPGDDEFGWTSTPTQQAPQQPMGGPAPMPYGEQNPVPPQQQQQQMGGFGPRASMDQAPIPPQQQAPIPSQQQEPIQQPTPQQPTMGIPVPQPDVLPPQPLSTEMQTPGALGATTSNSIQGKIEDRIRNVNSVHEWPVLKEALQHQSIVHDLVMQNSEYEGLVQMLEVLDTRITSVWRDSSLTYDQKFSEIKKIGLQKSSMRAGVNSIMVDKAISIITTIVISAQRTVDEKLNAIDSAVYKISSDQNSIGDTSHIEKAIQKRTEVQIELLSILRNIMDIYKSINQFIDGEILELDRNLPSSNAYINDRVKPIGTQIFTPINTAELTCKIAKALQENKLVWSQLEERVNECINSMFELCRADEQIISYQTEVINMLRANRVEEVVVADTLLKRVLRLYTGADNTGRSATAITWSGILSRRNNTLLIDLTARSKFRDYGITPVLLSNFLSERIERPFLCVETRGKLDPEDVQKLIAQIRSRLNYYQYVNVIVAPEDIELLKQLSEEAYVVHYITDCSTASISTLKEIVAQNDVKQIARKLVMIDAPISPISIADSIGIDPTITKLITLPALSEVRACALKHDRPFDYPELVAVYEEAFR